METVSMRHWIAGKTWVCAIWIGLLSSVVVPTPSVAEDDEATHGSAVHWDHDEEEHQFIRITESGLRPDVQRISPEMALGWLNYSSHIARVSFDEEVSKHLVCRTSGAGAFQVTEKRLISPKIQSSQFASLCSLARGTYSYEVETFSGIGTGGGRSQTYPGKIIVE